jgi:hypothetical protein
MAELTDPERCEDSPTAIHRWCGGKCLDCGNDNPDKLGTYEDRPGDGH